MSEQNAFLAAYRGSFRSALRWEQLDALWQAVQGQTGGVWYVYAVGEEPPTECVDDNALTAFVKALDELLRREHDEDYCGIVYADDLQEPKFVKIYDPNNLGSVCGSGSAPPPFPGWILSQLPPIDLQVALAPPANRRRWWRRLFQT